MKKPGDWFTVSVKAYKGDTLGVFDGDASPPDLFALYDKVFLDDLATAGLYGTVRTIKESSRAALSGMTFLPMIESDKDDHVGHGKLSVGDLEASGRTISKQDSSFTGIGDTDPHGLRATEDHTTVRLSQFDVSASALCLGNR